MNIDFLKQTNRIDMRGYENKNFYIPIELRYTAIEEGIIVPGVYYGDSMTAGVMDSEGNLDAKSTYNELQFKGRKLPKLKAIYKPKKAVFLGTFFNIWGHAITEGLNKVWFTATSEFRNLQNSGADFVYVTVDNKKLPEYTRRILLLAGFDISSAIHITEPVQYDEVIVPDNSFIQKEDGRYYTSEYLETIKKIKDTITSNNGSKKTAEKLYFTRTHLKCRKDMGEGEIETLFKSEGYEIVAPEENEVEHNIYMLMNCEAFAATEGSVSQNSIFCNPDTKVTIIRKGNFYNTYQLALCDAAKVNAIYVDAHHSSMISKERPWDGPFYVCITKEMEKYFGKKIKHRAFWIKPDYWEYIISAESKKAGTAIKKFIKQSLHMDYKDKVILRSDSILKEVVSL